jgi:hypothetical protein
MNTNIFDSIDNITESQFNVTFDSPNVSTSTQNAFPKKSSDNNSMTRENVGNNINNKSDSKENIRKILKKNYSSTQIQYGKDLAEFIPGLYRLLDLCKDDGSNGLGKFTYVCDKKRILIKIILCIR